MASSAQQDKRVAPVRFRTRTFDRRFSVAGSQLLGGRFV